jgi:two-component system, NtrC family, sensor histidine kinase KinB
MLALMTIPGESEQIQALEGDYANYLQQFSDPTELLASQRSLHESPLSVYQELVYPLFARVREACIQLRNLNEETMYSASVRAGWVASRAIWSTVLVVASAMIIALFFSIWLAGRIVRPLRRFMEVSRKISGGNYTVQVPIEAGDELGHLAGEFNQMAAQLARYHEMNIKQVISEKIKGEAILASIGDGLVVFDNDLRLTNINPAARRALSLEFTDLTGQRCSDILPSSNVCDLIRETVGGGMQPSVPEEHRIVNIPDGDDSRHYLFSVTPIAGKDRGVSGIVLLLRDITRLMEVERLKSEFVMAASHELRTPLTSIAMSIDLLLERAAGGLAEKHRELLFAAHEEVHRMKALVNDLLDLAKIEAGRIELELESVPVRVLFDYVQAAFSGQVEEERVSITAELSEDLPKIRADANKVTWVLTNLVSNALRYVGEGGRIHLTASGIGTLVHISVGDDGPGIPLEYQTKIFEKFVQVKGRESGGTGLGLAICKEIVRAHGGAIWVESLPGEGSRFTFTIPMAL